MADEHVARHVAQIPPPCDTPVPTEYPTTSPPSQAPSATGGLATVYSERWEIESILSLIKRLNPARRQRSNPSVIKRKIYKWLTKRDHHTHWPQPAHSPKIHLTRLTERYLG